MHTNRTRSFRLACIGLVLFLSGHLRAEPFLSPTDAVHSFITAADLTVELVAAEPLVTSPCALAFDGPRRLFVAENNGYPSDGSGLGNIVLLEDTNHDGTMDRRTVFASELPFPNGVLPFRNGLLVTAAPDLVFLKDTDGDGKADHREVWITGFDTTKSTQLRVNKPMVGPDGWIYLAAGLVGGELTVPSHPDRPAFKMIGDIRIHPDSREIQTTGGKAQYGQTFDPEGRRFICMNRIPVQHVVLRPEWLAMNPRLAFTESVQDCNPRSVKSGFAGDKGGVRLHPVSSNITTADSHTGSFSAACAIHFFNGKGLPDRYQNTVFSCDPTGNLVHADRLTPDGASFNADPLLFDHEPVASADDWFRPVFLTTGPDGCLYIADMYRKTIEHPDYLAEEVRKRTDFLTGRDKGRIWRVKASGRPSPKHAAPTIAPSKATLAFNRLVTSLSTNRPLSPDELATIAVQGASDRWVRALVVSQISGREEPFLRAIWPELHRSDPGVADILALTARSFEKPERVLDLLPELGPAPTHLEAALIAEIKAPSSHQTVQNVASKALESIKNEQLSIGSSKPLINLVTRLDQERSVPALTSVWLAPNPNEVRIAAFRALASLSPSGAAENGVPKQVWSTLSPELRDAVISSLGANPSKPEALLHLVETEIIPPAAIPSRTRQALLKSAPTPLVQRVKKAFDLPTSSKAETAKKITQALELPFTSANGKALFATLCSACHRLEQTGSVLGPDLFDIRRQTKDVIAFHIANPDAEVAPAFTGYSITLRSGNVLTGLITGETAENLTVRMPGGISETVRRSDTTALNPLPGSIMPPGLLDALSAQQVADLLAFLKGQ